MKTSPSHAASTRRRLRKAMGVHYTPPGLARFVAERLVSALSDRPGPVSRVLDPACGDGGLLRALLESLGSKANRTEAVAVEADAEALSLARSRLSRAPARSRRFVHGDFLDLVANGSDARALWGDLPSRHDQITEIDVAIANPPYVRTQVLGAKRAQELAERFELNGRVDLQHAFIVALTTALRVGGLLGIIASNRFLTTNAGASIRGFLGRNYEIIEIVDFGDTKLFEAAVLPVVVIARRRVSDRLAIDAQPVRFGRVYSVTQSEDEPAKELPWLPSVFDVLRANTGGRFRIPQGCFEYTQGQMQLRTDTDAVWPLTTASESDWIRRLRSKAHGVLADFAIVRVGIKTTADEVFIRRDWDSLPVESRPEDDLLRPLLTHEDASRWARNEECPPLALVVYPHEVMHGKRRPVDLADYPRTRAYFEVHRKRLQSREYVIQAGRKWYEIWVPQNPDQWGRPKIVFPDISPEPRFFLDNSGSIVNGDCYWLELRDATPPDMLLLLLAISNSRLMTRFHDLSFHNKLYSGRRRYITQYVEQYPCPDPSSAISNQIVKKVQRLTARLALSKRKSADISTDDDEIESLVAEAFGLTSE